MIGRGALAYLVVYVLLVLAAYVSLWRAGLLGRLPRGPLVLSVVVAVVFGALFLLAFRRDDRPK